MERVSFRLGMTTVGTILAASMLPGVSAFAAPARHASDTGAHAHAVMQHKAAKAKRPAAAKVINGTIVLAGTMSTNHTLTATGALSVGDPVRLDWDLPLVQSISINGYVEKVGQVSFVFNTPPTSWQDVTVGDNVIRRFHWESPPENSVLTVTETIHVLVTSELSPLSASDTYPLQSVPAAISPYLDSTHAVQLPAAATALTSTFSSAQSSEGAVVERVANWVATHTHYRNLPGGQPIDAISVFQTHVANCEGYDDLMAGMLRQLHIPVQIVFGWVSAQPLRLPAPHRGTSSIGWSVPGTQGALHSWLNVWFPSVGWVPFDPQVEKFFVDPRHIALYTNYDADGANLRTVPDDSDTGDVWFGAVNGDVPDDSGNLLGSPLSNGASESVPADGDSVSKVSLESKDSFHVTYHGIHHDITGELMFSR